MTQIKDLLPDSDALNAVRADGRAVDELRPVKVIRGRLSTDRMREYPGTVHCDFHPGGTALAA